MILSCYLQQCKQCEVVLNYVLFDWEGGPDGKKFGWSWPKVKCFPVRPDLNQSMSIFYHMTVVLFFWQSENASMAAFASFRARFSSRAFRVFPALSLGAYGPRNFFFHMVFQRNWARGRTDHMIKCDESRDSTVISRSWSCAILSRSSSDLSLLPDF